MKNITPHISQGEYLDISKDLTPLQKKIEEQKEERKKILKDIVSKSRIGISDFKNILIEVICKCCGISPEELEGKSRKKEFVYPRHYYATIMRHTKINGISASLKEIGRCLGGRHHSTIISSEKSFEDLNVTNKTFSEKFESILNELSLKMNEKEE